MSQPPENRKDQEWNRESSFVISSETVFNEGKIPLGIARELLRLLIAREHDLDYTSSINPTPHQLKEATVFLHKYGDYRMYVAVDLVFTLFRVDRKQRSGLKRTVLSLAGTNGARKTNKVKLEKQLQKVAPTPVQIPLPH